MKTGRVFWGVFLLTLGAAFLLEKFGVLDLHWRYAWQFWPVALIAWGVAVLFGGKTVKLIAVIVAAIVLALVLVAISTFSWGCDEPGEAAMTQDFHEEYVPGTQRATFRLESGAGSFSIQDTTTDFVEVFTETSLGKYTLDREGDSDAVAFTLQLDGARKSWHLGRTHNEARIHLNTAPVWDIDLQVGAAKMQCDLSAYKVENLNVDCGAASVDLRLGSGVKETMVNIDAGASSLAIEVPAAVGCEVRLEAPLSSKNLPGFTRLSKGHYQSENFDTAGEHCRIDVDAGVSSIRIERY